MRSSVDNRLAKLSAVSRLPFSVDLWTIRISATLAKPLDSFLRAVLSSALTLRTAKKMKPCLAHQLVGRKCCISSRKLCKNGSSPIALSAKKISTLPCRAAQ